MTKERVKLGDTATFVNGYAFKPSDWSEEGREIIRIQNLTKSTGESNRFNGDIPERYLVKRGDLLISWSATLGVYEWDGEEAWLNQHIFKVVFNKKNIDKKFFKYLIESKLHELERQVHGATMKHITKDKFDSIPVDLPPLHIQKQIADTLAKADALRRKDQELLQKYDELKRSIYFSHFEHKSENHIRLSELSKGEDGIKCGPFGTQLLASEFKTAGIPLWGIRHVNKGFTVATHEFLTEEKAQELYTYSIIPGDLVMTRKGTIGNICIYPHNFNPGVMHSDLLRIRVNKERVHPIFLQYQFRYSELLMDSVKRISNGAIMAGINVGKLKQLEVELPSMERQLIFVNEITIAERLEKTLTENILKSTTLFESLLIKHFS